MPKAIVTKQADFTEHESASETVFKGRLLHVKRDAVSLPDGKPATREYVEHNGAVMIIPLASTGTRVEKSGICLLALRVVGSCASRNRWSMHISESEKLETERTGRVEGRSAALA